MSDPAERSLLRPRPRLGVRLHGGLAPWRCVALARAAEAACLDSVWFAENPFHRGVLPAASAAAAATETIRIGIGVFNPFNRHPTLIAMEIAALDELARGRAALGIGAGIGGAVERMGFRYDRPLAAVGDAITIVRGLLAGDTVDHAGKVFSARDVKLDFAAMRPDMPIFMAARGDAALRLCGRIADGLMVSNMSTGGFTAHAVATMAASGAEAGREAQAEIVQYVPCAVRPDRDTAVALAKSALAEMLPGFWALGEQQPAARAALMLGSGIDEAEFAQAVDRLAAGDPPAKALDDRFVEALTVAGTAEECLARAADYAAAGVTELVLTFAGDNAAEDIATLGAAAGA